MMKSLPFLLTKGNLIRLPGFPMIYLSRESKQEWFGTSDNLKKDIVKATQGNTDSPGPPRPHKPPRYPPRPNPKQQAYYSDGLADAFKDVHDDYYEDQKDFQDNEFQEDNLNDPGTFRNDVLTRAARWII